MPRFTGQDIAEPERQDDKICHQHGGPSEEEQRKTKGYFDSFQGWGPGYADN
jgi:hypothetical protein